MTDTPLSSLCAVCHSQIPKYTCPRDFTQTCSVRCVQLHKKQALCNGRRNPASYVKKDDLQTPAGVDRDFNFLTGVERGLDRASEVAQERGIPVTPIEGEGDESYSYGGAKRRFGRAGGNGEKLERAIVESGIEIKRAPVGMSRKKANKTQWHSERNCINWTVEWVLDDGSKIVRSTPEDMPIEAAYRRLFTHAHSGRGGGKKRKRDGKEGKDAAKAGPAGKSADVERSEKQPHEAEEAQASAGAQEENAAQPQSEQQQQQVRPIGEPTPPPSPRSERLAVSEAAAQNPSKQKKARQKHQHHKLERLVADEPRKYFYLHAPLRAYRDSTAANYGKVVQFLVVVPIAPDQALRDVLPGRTLLEFPTVFAFDLPVFNQPDEGTGFITEDFWRRKVLGLEEVDTMSEGPSARAAMGELRGKGYDLIDQC